MLILICVRMMGLRLDCLVRRGRSRFNGTAILLDGCSGWGGGADLTS